MARKAIPNATQAKILLKSRRRCCLCFWLKGEDEVKKGQLAHLDGDNGNAAEDNFAFLCLEHHDEYDSIPRLSKGLREEEAKRWRDELYKEMEYRFRTVRKFGCEVTVVRLLRTYEDSQYDYYCAEFRLKNSGDSELRSPVVSFNLNEAAFSLGFSNPRPQWDPKFKINKVSMTDAKCDLFEPNGRIGTVNPTPILLRDHSVTFLGFSFNFGSRFRGQIHTLEYRVDAEGMTPVSSEIQFQLAQEVWEMKPFSYLVQEGSAVLGHN